MSLFFSNALFSFKTAKKVIIPSLACMILMPPTLNAEDRTPVVQNLSLEVQTDSEIRSAHGVNETQNTGSIIQVGDRRERKRKMRRRKVKQIGESLDALKDTTPSTIGESIKKTTSSTVSKIKTAFGQPAPKKRPGADFSTPVPKRLITRPSESNVMKHLEELYVKDGREMPDFRPLIKEYEKSAAGVDLKKIEEPKPEIQYEDFADSNLKEKENLTPREQRMRKLEEELLEKELLRAEKTLHPEGSLGPNEIHPEDKIATSESKKKSFWQKALPFLDRSDKREEKLKNKLGLDDAYPDMKSIENAPVVSNDGNFEVPSIEAPKPESLKKLIVKKHSPILEKIEKAKVAIEEQDNLEKETEAIVKSLEQKAKGIEKKTIEKVKVETPSIAKVEKPAKTENRPSLDFNADPDGFSFFEDENEVDSKMADTQTVKEPAKVEKPLVKKVEVVKPKPVETVVQKSETPKPKFPVAAAKKPEVKTQAKFPTEKIAATPKVVVKPKGNFPTPTKAAPVQASKNPFQFPKGGIAEADEVSKAAPKSGVRSFPTHIVSKTEVKKLETKKPGPFDKQVVAKPAQMKVAVKKAVVDQKAGSFPIVTPAVKPEIKQPAKVKTSVVSLSKKVPTRLTSMTSKPAPDPRYLRISSRKNLSGFKGFCPVALRDSRQLVDVALVHRSTYEGQAYHFSSEEALFKFNSDPERYAPASRGIDVVDLKTSGESHIGRLDHAAWFKGRLYLFDNDENRKNFVASPADYATR